MYPNPQDILPFPQRPSLEQYKKRAKDLLKAGTSTDSDALRSWINGWIEDLARLTNSEIAASFTRNEQYATQLAEFIRTQLDQTKPSLSQAQFVIARTHGFESWPRFAKHLTSLTSQSSETSTFERAADAVVVGDLGTLAKLLRENVGLTSQRSTREHGATLLIYVAANGVENYRQRTPGNIVAIAEVLLKAGADVNAAANVYGGHSTTLGLAATSIHPQRAGVQEALMELLIRNGATLDYAVAPDYAHGLIVNACLANGRGRAAAYLAAQGAHLDLEGAAGVGRLDVVKTVFNDVGKLKSATKNLQMERALMWASEFGRNEVVEFLLEKGASLHSKEATGLTALHWAVIGGQIETIKLLLARGASLATRNIYDGDALGQAVWAAINDESGLDHVPTVEFLLEAEAQIEEGSLGWIARQRNGTAETKARLVELLKRHGASS